MEKQSKFDEVCEIIYLYFLLFGMAGSFITLGYFANKSITIMLAQQAGL